MPDHRLLAFRRLVLPQCRPAPRRLLSDHPQLRLLPAADPPRHRVHNRISQTFRLPSQKAWHA
jgi:hypothetical protein